MYEALGRHATYGGAESFLLPRGAMGRLDPDWSIDAHVGYARKLGRDYELEIFTDLFNLPTLVKKEGVVRVNEVYTFDVGQPDRGRRLRGPGLAQGAGHRGRGAHRRLAGDAQPQLRPADGALHPVLRPDRRPIDVLIGARPVAGAAHGLTGLCYVASMAEGLNPAQQAAVDHGDGPLCVLAGAGSGKTRVLVHRIERLVQRGAWPQEILAVTFSNKAAGEMRERLRALLGSAAHMMWIGTFHATCARLLRIHHGRVGLSRDFSIFDDDDQLRLINGLLKEQGLSDSVTPRTVQTLIDRAKNRGADPGSAGPGRTYAHDIAASLYPAYQAALAREDAVDFNDLLLKVLELADHPEVGPELAARFRHVLVDEFQDTNLVQYRLVRHLAGRSRNLTVVGDDDQAIYGWRGAEPRNLLDFELDFPDAVVIKLEQNYRSTSVILDAANGVIARNTRSPRQGAVDRPAGGRADPVGGDGRRPLRGRLRGPRHPRPDRRGGPHLG